MDRRDFLNVLTLSLAELSLQGCRNLTRAGSIKNRNGAQDDRPKVLLVGIDGLRPDALDKAKTPMLDKLIHTGMYSDKVLADPPTWSAHGWSDILTGVRSDKHGVVDNTFKGRNYENYPGFFTRLKEIKPGVNSLSLVSWSPLQKFLTKGAKINSYYPYENNGDKMVAQEAASYLRRGNSDVIFAYFVNVDLAGHKYGFDPPVKEYLQKIEEVDSRIGLIMEEIRKRPPYENWLVMVISDHGGTREGHGGDSLEERSVPHIVNGRSIKPGIYWPPPRHVDVVPTILNHLQVPINPKWNLDGEVRLSN